jgi:hypothetical protein
LGRWSRPGLEGRGSEPGGDLVGRGPPYGAAVPEAPLNRVGSRDGWVWRSGLSGSVGLGPPSGWLGLGEGKGARRTVRWHTARVSWAEPGKSANYRSSRSNDAQIFVISCKESTCEQGSRCDMTTMRFVEAEISGFLKKISKKGLTRGATFRIFALPFGRNGTLTNTHQGLTREGRTA